MKDYNLKSNSRNNTDNDTNFYFNNKKKIESLIPFTFVFR